jgi:LemA protein
MGYNTAAEQFPANVIASMFSFKPAELLAATEGADEKKAVKVQF